MTGKMREKERGRGGDMENIERQTKTQRER